MLCLELQILNSKTKKKTKNTYKIFIEKKDRKGVIKFSLDLVKHLSKIISSI